MKMLSRLRLRPAVRPCRLLSYTVIALAALLVPTSDSAIAAVRLPHILSDHAVLQRNAPIHIWGWSDPGEEVAVTLGKRHQTTIADAIGRWSLYLPPMPAGGPYQLQVHASNDLILSDVLVGDLWIASGQSNMEMPLAGFGKDSPVKDGEKEIAAATEPAIRLLHVPLTASTTPATDTAANWTTCTPETAKSFSAIAYFFGRELQREEHVPIGLIDSTWGGTPAESWTSMDALARNGNLAGIFLNYADFQKTLVDLEHTTAAEEREDQAALSSGKPAPKHPWHPNPVSWTPANLYNAMIAPLTPYSIRGVIWYQGETNSALERVPHYHELFSTLIQDWRDKFQQGNFPFLFAQISSFRSTDKEAWGALRDAQRRTLTLTNTAMAVTLDTGESDDVHPSDKQTVAHRLALAARSLSYKEPLEFSGPLYQRLTTEGKLLRIWFNHAGPNLVSSGSLTGFEIAGSDHRFEPATARIDGATVLVESATIPLPVYVRYAWPNVSQSNLRNAAGLPASTFTSEDAPGQTVLLP